MIAMIYDIWKYVSTFQILLLINYFKYVFTGKTHWSGSNFTASDQASTLYNEFEK